MKRVGKRFLTLLLVGVILCSFMVMGAAATDDPQVVVSTATGAVGGTVEITVSLQNNPGIAAFKIPIVYNHNALELVNVADPEDASQAHIYEDGEYSLDTRTDFKKGTFTLFNDTAVWYTNTDLTKSNAVYLKFKIKDGAHSGTYKIGIGNAQYSNTAEDNNDGNAVFSNYSEQYVKFALGSGTVTVTGGSNHSYTETVDKAATCKETGSKTLTCSCGETKTETIAIDSNNHTNTETRNAKTATCKDEGNTGDTYCNDCEQTIETGTSIPKTNDHSWGTTGLVTKEASCTETGEETYTCSVCGATQTKAIPTTAHETELRNAKAATCGEIGNTGDTYCTKCNTKISDGSVIPIDPENHNWNAGKVTKAATCTTDGEETYTCQNSGCTVQTKTKPIPATGHDWDEGTVTKAATCTETGVMTFTCTKNCCTVETKTEVIEKIAHDYDLKDYVAATCTAEGYSGDQVCKVCKETVKGNTTEKIEHSWNSGEVTTAATTSSTGVMTYTCQVCSATKTEEIAKLEDTTTLPTVPSKKPDSSDTSEEPSEEPTEPEEPGTGETETPVFTDVPEDTWYSGAVAWAVQYGITKGTTDTTFSPEEDCTRAQVVTFLWRVAGCPEPTTTENPFTDVVEDNDYYKAILWAAENGITTGTGDGTFSPDDSCTRAQIVTFLWRASGKPETDDTDVSFTDVSEGQYYSDAVAWAASKEITNGVGDGLFDTTGICNRAQVVTFLYRNAQD
jgi:hypothetical protein